MLVQSEVAWRGDRTISYVPCMALGGFLFFVASMDVIFINFSLPFFTVAFHKRFSHQARNNNNFKLTFFSFLFSNNAFLCAYAP